MESSSKSSTQSSSTTASTASLIQSSSSENRPHGATSSSESAASSSSPMPPTSAAFSSEQSPSANAQALQESRSFRSHSALQPSMMPSSPSHTSSHERMLDTTEASQASSSSPSQTAPLPSTMPSDSSHTSSHKRMRDNEKYSQGSASSLASQSYTTTPSTELLFQSSLSDINAYDPTEANMINTARSSSTLSTFSPARSSERIVVRRDPRSTLSGMSNNNAQPIIENLRDRQALEGVDVERVQPAGGDQDRVDVILNPTLQRAQQDARFTRQLQSMFNFHEHRDIGYGMLSTFAQGEGAHALSRPPMEYYTDEMEERVQELDDWHYRILFNGRSHVQVLNNIRDRVMRHPRRNQFTIIRDIGAEQGFVDEQLRRYVDWFLYLACFSDVAGEPFP